MIEAGSLTKQYGDKTAVRDLSFVVRPGLVTGFLGPNGAGKSTTMRMIADLDKPDHGEVLLNGERYRRQRAPLATLGTLLDARAVHPRRSAYHHLLALATSNGIGRRRVAQVLAAVGLSEVAHTPAGTFSLGMSQRLGIAAALLGDPGIIVLDEPVNGLDPEGIRWARRLLRGLAAEGRTVLVSSHLMSEMAQTADQLIVIGRGRLIADLSMAEMTASVVPQVVVRTPRARELAQLLSRQAASVTTTDPRTLSVTGPSSAEIGQVALDHQIIIHELTPVHPSLEEAYLAMTRHDSEYTAEPAEPNRRRAAA